MRHRTRTRYDLDTGDKVARELRRAPRRHGALLSRTLPPPLFRAMLRWYRSTENARKQLRLAGPDLGRKWNRNRVLAEMRLLARGAEYAVADSEDTFAEKAL